MVCRLMALSIGCGTGLHPYLRLITRSSRLMAADESEETHMPVNIGNPGEFTVSELAELLKEMTGSSSEIVFHPLPQDDPKQRRLIIDRANALLGWEPRVPLREGLIDT